MRIWLVGKKIFFHNFLWILAKKVTFWKEFPLSSRRNSKSCSIDVFSFLNMFQKSIFCHGISWNVLHKFRHIFFIFFPYISNINLNTPSRFLSLTFFGGQTWALRKETLLLLVWWIIVWRIIITSLTCRSHRPSCNRLAH